MNLKKIFATLFLLVFVSVPLISFAGDECKIPPNVLDMLHERGYTKCKATCDYIAEPECGTCCLIATIFKVANWAFILILAASVFVILLAAKDYLTSQGNAEKLEAANKKIVVGAAAVIIALFAKAAPGIILSIIA
ncbi:MAG: hypothetical protein WC157_03435 [Candidatus Paceibacterota bacterium]